MALVKHPLVQGVGFTGSRSGGRALMDAAAARPTPIPVYAEMGSVNPVFLLSQALAERGGEIAKGLHASVTLGNGQFCTNPGMVFYQAGRGADAFIAQLSALMAATPAGAMLTSSIRDEYINGVARFASTGGVKTLVQNEGSGTCCGAALFQTDGRSFLARSTLMNEVFGPSTLLIEAASDDELLACARALEGQLTATIHATPQELLTQRELLSIVEKKAGRLVFNGFPTGVEVCHSMHHGGPYPATSEGRSTSVGTRAILRFVRPACFQNFPDAALPAALQDINPLGIMRLVDGKLTR
jgi:NADP-dependent aldehyde dehydrogenase